MQNEIIAHRLFREFLETSIIGNKCFLTGEKIDWDFALQGIKNSFTDKPIEGKKHFEDKLKVQFKNADYKTKLAFANLEYLWAMPASCINKNKKKEYPKRWDIKIENPKMHIFIDKDDCIGGTGQWHRQNKYYEICSLLNMVKFLKDKKVQNIKDAYSDIEKFAFDAIYNKNKSEYSAYFQSVKCCTNNVLLHLSNPKKYAPIFSYGDKESIVKYFTKGIYTDERKGRCLKYINALQNLKILTTDTLEDKIRKIKDCLYDLVENDENNIKERWLFYSPDIKYLWKPKTKKQRENAIFKKIEQEIIKENDCDDYPEGEETKSKEKTLRKRNSKVTQDIKKRDKYTCLVCKFNYKNEVVEAHHLDPFGNKKGKVKVKKEDFVTLCPNCHRIAHRLLENQKNMEQWDKLYPILKDISDEPY